MRCEGVTHGDDSCEIDCDRNDGMLDVVAHCGYIVELAADC